MGLVFDEGLDGQTPLDAEEKCDLIPSLVTRADLNEWEQDNILEARNWVLSRRTLMRQEIFNENFLKNLHKRMFRQVWKWAGKFRTSEKNIGDGAYEIAPNIRQLTTDAGFWLENGSFAIEEMAVRFHHRLVKIHPFVNGNGRHARLCADAIVEKYGGKKLNWGSNSRLAKPNEIRARYIAALQAADKGNYDPILAFSSS